MMTEQKIKQNLHTHSCYDDGKNSIDEMIQTALKKGFTVLGFSGHSPNRPLDDGSMSEEGCLQYRNDIHEAQKKYAGQIDLYCGIELDSLSAPETDPYDYVIGSVHYLQENGNSYPVDYSEEEFRSLLNNVYQGDMYKMIKAYYGAVEAMIETRDFSILGHIDLISKYNESETYFAFSDERFLDEAMKAARAAIDKDILFEINTGAIARGWRSLPYPHPLLLEKIVRAGGKFVISTDCHNAENLDQSMALALDLARKAGITSLYVLEDGQFAKHSIDEFAGEDD